MGAHGRAARQKSEKVAGAPDATGVHDDHECDKHANSGSARELTEVIQ
jgi:hypothetical protein